MSRYPTRQHQTTDVNQENSTFYRRRKVTVERGREMLQCDREPFDVTEHDIGDPCEVTTMSSDPMIFRDDVKKPMSERLGPSRKPVDEYEQLGKSHQRSRGRKRARSSAKPDGGHRGKYKKRSRHGSSGKRDGREKMKHHRTKPNYTDDLEPVSPDSGDHVTFTFDESASRDESNYRDIESRNHGKRDTYTRSPDHFDSRYHTFTFADVTRPESASQPHDKIFDRNDSKRVRVPLPDNNDFNRVNRGINHRQQSNQNDFQSELALRETEEGELLELTDEPIEDQRDRYLHNNQTDKITELYTGYTDTESTALPIGMPSQSIEFNRESHHHLNNEDHRIGVSPLYIDHNRSLEEQLECSEFEEDVVAEIIYLIATQNGETTIKEMLRLARKAAGIPFSTEEQLISFLRKHIAYFELVAHSGTCIVHTRTDIRVCQIYVSKANASKTTCSNSCRELHICKFHLFGTCKKEGKCNLEHDLYSEHNIPVLIQARLHRTPQEDISRIMSLPRNRNLTTLPAVCKYYNNQTTCKKDACPHLHICKHKVENNCKFGKSCKRSHTLDTLNCCRVLRSFALFFENEYEEQMLLRLLNNNRSIARLPSSRYFQSKLAQTKRTVESPSKARAQKILKEMKIVEEKIKKRKLQMKLKEITGINIKKSSVGSLNQPQIRPEISLKIQVPDETHTSPCTDESMSQYFSPTLQKDTNQSPSCSPTSASDATKPFLCAATPGPLCSKSSSNSFGDMTQTVNPISEAMIAPGSSEESPSSKTITSNPPVRQIVNIKAEEQYSNDQSKEDKSEVNVHTPLTPEPLTEVIMETCNTHSAAQENLQCHEGPIPIKLEVDTQNHDHSHLASDLGCTPESFQYEQTPKVKLEQEHELTNGLAGSSAYSSDISEKHERETVVSESASMDVSDYGTKDQSRNKIKTSTDQQHTKDPEKEKVPVNEPIERPEILDSSSQSLVSETRPTLEPPNNSNDGKHAKTSPETCIMKTCEPLDYQPLVEVEKQSDTEEHNDGKPSPENVGDLKTSSEKGCDTIKDEKIIGMPEEKVGTSPSGSDLTVKENEMSPDNPGDTAVVFELKLTVNDVDSLHVSSYPDDRWDISSNHGSTAEFEGKDQVRDIIKQTCRRLFEASKRLCNPNAEGGSDREGTRSLTME